ncbi:MAG: pirin family protein, partial [Cyclobacteriaceae bacterium]|nr:pirin family protein [Cyclobacteriaceae bacterium]
LYFYKGHSLKVEGMETTSYKSIELNANVPVILENGPEESYLLLLQGRPINEPVIQYGPFVMNSEHEIHQAIQEYQQTQFGGWPWKSHDNVHGNRGRFAKHADGKEEIK